MKNPWRKYSKINPQRENGNRQIANDVFIALISASFTSAEYKVIFAIIHMTWGFGKDEDSISMKQFAEMTNLNVRTIQRALKRLNKLRVVYLSPFGRRAASGSPLNKYSFNKHYDTWRVEGCQIVQGWSVDHPPKAAKGGIRGILRVAHRPPTKETSTKEIIYKETRTPPYPPLKNFDQFWDAYPKKKSKGQAKKTWVKLLKEKKLPDISILINSVIALKNSYDWKKDGGKYIPYPSTWLSAEGWEDEAIDRLPDKTIIPRTVKEAKDIEQIQMAKFLNEIKRRESEEGIKTIDDPETTSGNERQLS